MVTAMMPSDELDITKMLHAVIDLELAIDDAQELEIGPEARRQTIFLQLDLKLSAFAELAGWANVFAPHKAADHDQLVRSYVTVLLFFLLFSAKRQWTHLVVLSEDQWKRITGADKKDKLADLDREYLAIKNFLNGAYYSRRQEDFRHAWHLLLKMGIVDFGISAAEIEKAYQTLIDEATRKYAQK